ncbi:MAG: hypothetical protein R6U78_03325 [Bacteroidales bacterium]
MERQNIEDHIFAFMDKTKHLGFDPVKLIEVVERKEKTFEKHWNEHLKDQMRDLPDFDSVWRDLGKHWRKFQKFVE